jgi:hypothetical protein
MGRKKDIVEEIEQRVKEIIDLKTLQETMQCNPDRSDYVRCVLTKAMIHVELRRRVDKLVYGLAFTFVSSESIEEKETIETVVNQLIEIGMLSDLRWQKAINDALRYRNKIDGVDARVRIRRIAEEVDKVFEEGLK